MSCEECRTFAKYDQKENVRIPTGSVLNLSPMYLLVIYFISIFRLHIGAVHKHTEPDITKYRNLTCFT